MHIINQVQAKAQQFIEANATTILTAGGVVGTVGTSVLAWRGGYKTGGEVKEQELEEGQFSSKQEKAKVAAPHAIPPVAAGVVTVASILMAHRMSAQKAAALAAAYGLTQNQFEEYKTKVTEKLGINKEQKIRDELAQDRVNGTPGHDSLVIIDGSGVLCFDQPTGRYFKSSMEKIKKAENAANEQIAKHNYVSASVFYDELELPPTTWSDDVGFNLDNRLELSFSSVLDPDDKPCLAIDFKNLPKEDYMRMYM